VPAEVGSVVVDAFRELKIAVEVETVDAEISFAGDVLLLRRTRSSKLRGLLLRRAIDKGSSFRMKPAVAEDSTSLFMAFSTEAEAMIVRCTQKNKIYKVLYPVPYWTSERSRFARGDLTIGKATAVHVQCPYTAKDINL
jgi:hypothetical protein